MDIRILGPVEVLDDDGATIPIGSYKVRLLLAALVLEAGRVLSVDGLIDRLWDEDPPGAAVVTLRAYVSNLRSALPDGHARITTRPPGYMLLRSGITVDAEVFEQAVRRGRASLSDDDPAAALHAFDEALGLWRGDALADVVGRPFATAAAARLAGMRLATVEDRFDALLAVGEHEASLPDLQAHAADHPLRDRPVMQLMTALYRAGRTPDALAAHREHRARLADELGLDPSPALEQLAARVLQQDEELLGAARSRESVPSATTSAAGERSTRTVEHVVAPDVPPTTAALQVVGVPSTAIDGLVGRAEETETIEGALASLAGGSGRILLLSGEPGIGKSALAFDLVQRAQDMGLPVLAGRCMQTAGSPPFWPWMQVLRGAHGQFDPDTLIAVSADGGAAAAHLDPSLGPPEGPAPLPADPVAARFAIYEAIAGLVAGLAPARGLVVVLDDLHWADAASCELVGFLTPLLRRIPLLLVGTYRDSSADVTPELADLLSVAARSGLSTTIRLHGLSPSDVAVMLARSPDGTAVPAAETDTVHRRTGGNPLFVRQLARYLTETGEAAHSALPTGVRDVLARRLARLAADVRSTLDVAAVLDQDVGPRRLAHVLRRPVAAVLNDLDAAVSHGLLRESGPGPDHQFSHALVSDVLLAELPAGRRALLHAAVADALATTGGVSPTVVADHLVRAGDAAPRDQTVRWLCAAADETRALASHERSELQLRHALTLVDGDAGLDELEIEIRLRLAPVVVALHGWWAPEVTDAVGPLLDAEETVDRRVVPLWWSVWGQHITSGQLRRSSELAHRLLRRIDPEDHAGLVAATSATAYSDAYLGGRHDQLTAVLDRGFAAETQARPGELAMTVEHLSIALRTTKVMVAALHGDAAGTVAAVEDAVAVTERLGSVFSEAYARMFSALAFAVLDDPASALTHARRGAELCDEASLPALGALNAAPLHWARAADGHDPRTEAATMQEALDGLTTGGQAHAQAVWRCLLAETWLRAGDRGAARAAVERAEGFMDHTGEVAFARRVALTRSRVLHA